MKRRDMRYSNAYNSLPDTKEMTFDEICPESRRAARITLIYRNVCRLINQTHLLYRVMSYRHCYSAYHDVSLIIASFLIKIHSSLLKRRRL